MKRHLAAAILILALLLVGAPPVSGGTASFTPPPVEGTIYAVINANRTPGARTTSITVTWGTFVRSVGRGNPYGKCAGSAAAGFVLKIRHTTPEARPFTLSTNGKIVRAPYQGAAPPEVALPCYKPVAMRARF